MEKGRDFIALNIALLTISDTRTPADDRSGTSARTAGCRYRASDARPTDRARRYLSNSCAGLAMDCRCASAGRY